MHPKVYAKLEELIEGLFNQDGEVCELISDEQWIADNLAHHMAKAAEAVYDASTEKEKWLKENGYMD